MHPVSGEEHNLTQNAVNDAHPAWSPTGDHIIFTSDRGGSYFQIYTMRSDGSDVQQVGVVPGNNAMFPRYSPDGSRIAFMRASITDPICLWNWDVWVMDANGGNQQRVTTHLGGDLYPEWTPDGTEIVYASCRNFLDFNLYAVNPDTGVEHQLNSWFLSDEWGAIYSPDEKHIAFNSDFDGNIEIYTMPAAGGTASNFTQHSADDLAASWGGQRTPESTYSISGQVIDINNNPIPSVTLHDDMGRTATTDHNGNYTLTGLAAGTHMVSPFKSGYTFNPAPRTVNVPPDATRQDFTGMPQPILLVTGWSGSEESLRSDPDLHYFEGWLEPYGYVEGRNLFYATDTSPYLFLHKNAQIIRDELCRYYPMAKNFSPDWSGHFDIIAHSYGGLRSRAYLENSDLYGEGGKECPDPENRIYVDNLFTLGTPHGGEIGDLPFSFWIGLIALIGDNPGFDPELPAMLEMLPPVRTWQNLTHKQPSNVCYRLLAGDASQQYDAYPWLLRIIYL